MCAAVAGQRGRRVALLDRNSLPGRKILISGGGRCNFTNLHCAPDRFLSANPHFAKSALALYTPRHFIELVRKYNIPYHEKTLGQLFCDHSAHAILDLLLAECAKGKVEHVPDAHSIQIEHNSLWIPPPNRHKANSFAQSLVAAPPAASPYPSFRAPPASAMISRQFGLNVIEPRPALVPLLPGGKESDWTQLAGVSALRPRQRRQPQNPNASSFVEKLLVTHRGLSGPSHPANLVLLGNPANQSAVDSRARQAHPHPSLLNGRRDAPAPAQSSSANTCPVPRLAEHLSQIAAPSGLTNAAL